MSPGSTGTAGSSLRAEHKLLTRGKLIDAAKALFSARGYIAVRVDDIAAAAGCGRATFYLHFNGKVDVLRALACRDALPSYRESYRSLDSVLDGGTLEDFTAWITDSIGWFQTNRELLWAWDEATALEPLFREDVQAGILTVPSAMPRYLERWPAQRRDEARLRIGLMVTQLERFFTRWAVQQTIYVSVDVAARVLADIWYQALQAPEALPAQAV